MRRELLDGVTIINEELPNITLNTWLPSWIINLLFVLGVIFLVFSSALMVTTLMDASESENTIKGRLKLVESVSKVFVLLLLLLLIPEVVARESSVVYTVQINEYITQETLTKIYDEYEIIEQNDRIWKIREK